MKMKWLLLFGFTSEVFLFCQFFGKIHVSYWWLLWFVACDMSTWKVFKKINSIKDEVEA